MSKDASLGEYEQTIRELSDRIVAAQKPIRTLDALKWANPIEAEFFKHKAKKLPSITPDYYQQNVPLNFDAQKKLAEFHDIEQAIRRRLGQYSGVGSIMQR